MTARQLPERPNLDHLKRQAKDLLRDAQTQDAVALARFRLLPALAPGQMRISLAHRSGCTTPNRSYPSRATAR